MTSYVKGVVFENISDVCSGTDHPFISLNPFFMLVDQWLFLAHHLLGNANYKIKDSRSRSMRMTQNQALHMARGECT